MTSREQRIRHHAKRLWEEAGSPGGGERQFIDRACELVAIEDNQHLATKPNPAAEGHEFAERDEPVESLKSVENLGDLPDLDDQQNEPDYPSPRNRPG